MPKISWPKELDSIGWLVTTVVAVAGIGFAVLVVSWKGETPSLGDWGDYLGGFFAAIAFVWLIVGHLHSQKRIEEGQKDLNTQMAFTQEVVSSLARLAMSAQLQDAARMADMLPVFVPKGAKGTMVGRSAGMVHPVSWHVQLQNEGEGVRLTGVTPMTEGVEVTVDKLGACPRNTIFVVNFGAKQPIKDFGKIACAIDFEDKIGRVGWAEIVVTFSNSHVDVKCQMGKRA